MGGTRFMVQWEEHPSHLATRLGQLLEHQTLVDVTLMCNTHTLRVHRAVLAACSPYFESILQRQLGMHPLIVLKDMQFSVLKSLIEFMYCGETSVTEDNLGALLQAAKFFQVKGLSAMTKEALGLVPSPKSTVNGDAARKAFVGRSKRVGVQQSFMTSGMKSLSTPHATSSHTLGPGGDVQTVSAKTSFQTVSKAVAARPDTQQQTDTAQLLLSLSGSEFPKQTFHTVSKNVRFHHNVSGNAVTVEPSRTLDSSVVKSKDLIERVPLVTPNGGMKPSTSVSHQGGEVTGEIPLSTEGAREDVLAPASQYITDGPRRRGRPVKRQMNLVFQEKVLTDADMALHKEAEASRKALEMLRHQMSTDALEPTAGASPSSTSNVQAGGTTIDQLRKFPLKQPVASNLKVQAQSVSNQASAISTASRTLTQAHAIGNPVTVKKTSINSNIVYKTIGNTLLDNNSKRNVSQTLSAPTPSPISVPVPVPLATDDVSNGGSNVVYKMEEPEIPEQVYQIADNVNATIPKEENVEYHMSDETAEPEVDLSNNTNIVYQMADTSNSTPGSVMSQYMEVLKEAGLPTDVPILLDSGDGSYVTVNEEVLMNIVNGGVLQCHVTEGNIVTGEGVEYIVQEITEDEMEVTEAVEPDVKVENTDVSMETEEATDLETNALEGGSEIIHANSSSVEQEVFQSQDPQDEFQPQVEQEGFQTQIEQEGFQTQIEQEGFQTQVEHEDYQSQVEQEDYQPQVEQEEFQPQVEQEGFQPQVEQEGFQPQVEEEGFQPQVDQEGFQPQVEQEDFQPQVEQEDCQPQVEQEDLQPQVEQEDFQPQDGQEDFQPQVEQEVFQPQVEQEEGYQESYRAQVEEEDYQSQYKEENLQSHIEQEDLHSQVQQEDSKPQVEQDNFQPQTKEENFEPQIGHGNSNLQAEPLDSQLKGQQDDFQPRLVGEQIVTPCLGLPCLDDEDDEVILPIQNESKVPNIIHMNNEDKLTDIAPKEETRGTERQVESYYPSEAETVNMTKCEPMAMTEGEVADIAESETADTAEGEAMDVAESGAMDVADGEAIDLTENAPMDIAEGESGTVDSGITMEPGRSDVCSSDEIITGDRYGESAMEGFPVMKRDTSSKQQVMFDANRCTVDRGFIFQKESSNNEITQKVIKVQCSQNEESEPKVARSGNSEMSVEQALQAMMGEGSDTEIEVCSNIDSAGIQKHNAAILQHEIVSKTIVEERSPDEETEDLRLVLSPEDDSVKLADESHSAEESISSYTLVLSPDSSGNDKTALGEEGLSCSTNSENVPVEQNVTSDKPKDLTEEETPVVAENERIEVAEQKSVGVVTTDEPDKDFEEELEKTDTVAEQHKAESSTAENVSTKESLLDNEEVSLPLLNETQVYKEVASNGEDILQQQHTENSSEYTGNVLDVKTKEDEVGEGQGSFELATDSSSGSGEDDCSVPLQHKFKSAAVSPSKDIPYAVGLLPLKTALEKLQSMPEYHPRKTRSSATGKEFGSDVPAARVKRKALSSDGPEKKLKTGLEGEDDTDLSDTPTDNPSVSADVCQEEWPSMETSTKDRKDEVLCSMPELVAKPTEG